MRAYAFNRSIPADVPRRWFVGMVEPGAGRKVVEALHDRDIDAYQPLETVWRRHPISKRRYPVTLPIFGQYLFVGVEHGKGFDQLHDIEGLQGLLRKTVAGERQPAEIAFEFVDDLRQAEARGDFDNTKNGKIEIKPGMPVNIIAGPFTGYVGQVKEARKDGRWLILTKALGGGPMEIEGFKIEARR